LAVYKAGLKAVIYLIKCLIAENQKIMKQKAARISQLEEQVKSLE